tara:strand:- start:530 stop:769 length:240 start_codon:yes stop_codon:yes gene_type:complete
MGPRERSYGEILQNSPMLNTSAAEAMFPSNEEKENLKKLANILDQAIDDSSETAETWNNIGTVKDVAIKIITTALGKPF